MRPEFELRGTVVVPFALAGGRSEVRLAPVSTAPTRMAQVSMDNDGERESGSQK
eukprot:CAMPEP_0181464290 /NCGR_PEP_ID=MMETSP1110-20121109/35353_1 /TAXON_ID=174948 /ORGANISM="Symbiodinium sp., Strain CCMP421" /LENGTH=53 /DNA_ID=CAMNT_0023589013 /DNA_START=236 /DNA_END=395 /DNA_ORIENTATION=-